MYENVKVGKFDIFATYSYAKGKMQGMSDEQAKEYGYMVAVMGARGKGMGAAKPTASGISVIKKAAEKKQKKSITAEVYTKNIEEKLGSFYTKVMLPKITKLVKQGVSYDGVKAMVKIPATRGAKITGKEFKEALV